MYKIGGDKSLNVNIQQLFTSSCSGAKLIFAVRPRGGNVRNEEVLLSLRGGRSQIRITSSLSL